MLQFTQEYIPILTNTLAPHLIAQPTPFTSSFLYFSLSLNEGVILKKIQIKYKRQTNPSNIFNDKKDDNCLTYWKSISNHPNVLPILDDVQDHQQIQFATPKALMSLDDLLNKQSANKTLFPIGQIVSFFKTALSVLKELENINAYHLNLDLTNMLSKLSQILILFKVVDTDLNIKVTDIAINDEIIKNFNENGNSPSQNDKKKKKNYISLEGETETEPQDEFFENNLYWKCLLSECRKDNGKLTYQIYDRFILAFSMLRLLELDSKEEFTKKLQSFGMPIHNFEQLQKALHTYIIQNQNSLYEKHVNNDVLPNDENTKYKSFQLVFSALKGLINDGKSASQTLRFFEPQTAENPLSTIQMIKGRTYDTRMYNTLTVDESVKKDVSTEKEDSNSGVDENPQFQSPLKESAQFEGVIIYLTNRYLSGISLVKETDFEDLKQFQHIKELFTDDQLSLFFRNTEFQVEKIKHFIQRELIIIRCSKANFQYFLIHSQAKSYFQQAALRFYIELEVHKAEETINWLQFASMFTGEVHIRLNNISKIGEFQQIKISNALNTIANMRSLYIKTESSLVTDGSFFTILANAISTYPALESLYLDASNNNIGIRAKKNEFISPDYKIDYSKKNLINEERKEENYKKIQERGLLKSLCLKLSQNQLNYAFMEVLESLISPLNCIEELELDLRFNDSLDEVSLINIIELISKMPLRTLIIGLPSDQLEELMEHLPNTLQILKLTCSETKIQEIELLRALNQIQLQELKLDFSKCLLSEKGTQKLGGVLAEQKTLRKLTLNLEKNSISEEGCQQLMRGISQQKNLTELELLLRTNHIETYGLSQLGSLKKLNNLSLDIFNNQIGDKGIGTVGLQLQKLNDIKKLKLDAGMNNINEGFIMIIGTILSQMKKILELDFNFEYNPMDEEPSIQKVEWPLKNLARTSPIQSLKIRFGYGKAQGNVFALITGLIGCFRQLRTLELSVSHNVCNDFESLGRSLCELKLLKVLKLDVSSCKMKDENLFQLPLNSFPYLSELSLNFSNNSFTQCPESIGLRVVELKRLKKLYLNLSNNIIDHDYISFMIDIFSRVEIEVLELIFNSMGLGNDDLIEMCKGILKMDSLNEFKLELRNTKVTEKSAQVLGQCLNQLPNLRKVDLDLDLRKINCLYDSSDSYRQLMSKLGSYKFQ